jgi:N-methylhydantoinase A
MRLSVDIGGTFTDLVVEDSSGSLFLNKCPTTPDDPIRGIFDVLEITARDMGISCAKLVRNGEYLIHATTWGINAVLTNTTARTAFLTTEGHPDVLLLREGGREQFNYIQPYPDPFIPRALTFEITERIGSQGEVVKSLDEAKAIDILYKLKNEKVEAVAVCLLWSIVNPSHEQRIGELLKEYLPGIPFTLSSNLNQSMREYSRGSSAAINASLKPIMTRYLFNLRDRLHASGFRGRLLLVTSSGGVMDLEEVAEAPIHCVKSGPAMAPVAGRYYGKRETDRDVLVVADTGGTSFDVSLVRHDTIPWTRETWLGDIYTGHKTGFPSIDIKSIGTGGGSIAWLDDGGLLHVGPQSAGAVPGPVCYRKGGVAPTVTDASLVMGYLDPDYFLGGALQVDPDAASKSLDIFIGQKMGISTYKAASAVFQVFTENMVQLIEEIALNQGIDPRDAVLIGGGGAAGLNSVAIARRLGCELLVIPEMSAALSAFGALIADLSKDYETTFMTNSVRFDYEKVNAVISDLLCKCRAFIKGSDVNEGTSRIELSAEIRYPSEIWELEVPLDKDSFASPEDIELLRQKFHLKHKELFGTNDPTSPIDILVWHAKVSCRLRNGDPGTLKRLKTKKVKNLFRRAYFPEIGIHDTPIRYFESFKLGERLKGPAIIESPFTTIVIDPGAYVERSESGNLLIRP